MMILINLCDCCVSLTPCNKRRFCGQAEISPPPYHLNLQSSCTVRFVQLPVKAEKERVSEAMIVSVGQTMQPFTSNQELIASLAPEH